MAKKTVAAKKRNVKVDAAGQLHVHSSFNNIIVCLANSEGQVISWSSAGKMGFRGSKKNTPYAERSRLDLYAGSVWKKRNVALRRTPPMLPRWQPRIAARSLTILVSAR